MTIVLVSPRDAVSLPDTFVVTTRDEAARRETYHARYRTDIVRAVARRPVSSPRHGPSALPQRCTRVA